MHVPKKNEKVRACIDFRDLNAASTKDEFMLSITDIMINNTCGFERMSPYGWLFRVESNQDVPG